MNPTLSHVTSTAIGGGLTLIGLEPGKVTIRLMARGGRERALLSVDTAPDTGLPRLRVWPSPCNFDAEAPLCLPLGEDCPSVQFALSDSAPATAHRTVEVRFAKHIEVVTRDADDTELTVARVELNAGQLHALAWPHAQSTPAREALCVPLPAPAA